MSIVSNFFLFSRIVFIMSNKMYCLHKEIYIVEMNIIDEEENWQNILFTNTNLEISYQAGCIWNE